MKPTPVAALAPRIDSIDKPASKHNEAERMVQAVLSTPPMNNFGRLIRVNRIYRMQFLFVSILIILSKYLFYLHDPVKAHRAVGWCLGAQARARGVQDAANVGP